MTQDKGFTLIEVVVVMGLIGIIAAAAAPFLLNTSKVVNRAAHQELVSTIRLAQTLSYSTESIIRMDIDAADHCYGLYVIQDEDIDELSNESSPLRNIECGKAELQPVRTTRLGDLSHVVMDPQVRVNKNVQIYFYPNGQTLPDDVEFKLRNQYSIHLDGQTGYLTYED